MKKITKILVDIYNAIPERTVVDDFVEIVKNDSARYAHRRAYSALVSTFNADERAEALRQLRRIDYCLWSYIDERV